MQLDWITPGSRGRLEQTGRFDPTAGQVASSI